jgi:hypothetical protein
MNKFGGEGGGVEDLEERQTCTYCTHIERDLLKYVCIQFTHGGAYLSNKKSHF